jgi:mgtE-like transporter
MPSESQRDEDVFESQFIDMYLSEYASISSFVREALPFELLATVGRVIAGIILSGTKQAKLPNNPNYGIELFLLDSFSSELLP